MEKNTLLKQIENNLQIIQSKRPLSEIELRELQKSLGVFFTYHNNAIEGNTISLSETKILLEDGLTIGGKTVTEMQETLNHKKVLEFLYDCIQKNTVLDEQIIKKIHTLVLADIDEHAGEYRKIQVYISGEEQLPPKASKIEAKMNELIAWYSQQKTSDILHTAIKLHYDFVKIHPFIDGNGRVARVLLNLALMRAGFPMIIIPLVRRAEYIGALNSSKNYDDFEVLMLDIINVNLEDYLRIIGRG